MREIFKDIDGFENLYAVSNFGRIKRKETQSKRGSGNYFRKERFLNQRQSDLFAEIEGE